MDITGLTLNEVGEKIKEYLPPILQYDFQFQESHQLEFNEICHNIDKKYHKLFKDNDIFSCANGSVEDDDFECDYIVMLVSNEDSTQALFLLLQTENKSTGKTETELLQSFVPAEIDKIESNITIDQLTQYRNTLDEVIRVIEKHMTKMITKKIKIKFKKLMFEVMKQTITILEDIQQN